MRFRATESELPTRSEIVADASYACTECQREAVLFTFPVWKRRIRYPAAYCAEHAEIFLANYRATRLEAEGPPLSWGDAVGFDLELLVIDNRAHDQCWFYLTELGGARRLECRIGIFEAAALQRELERLCCPRPLTHRAMASLIPALGGKLEHVLIDKLTGGTSQVYEAKLYICQRRRNVIVDVRPSDGLVLAVICEVPIYVAQSVLTALGM